MIDASEEITHEEAKEEEEFNLLEFLDIEDEDGAEEVIKKVEAKMGTSIQTMRESLSQWVIQHAEEMTLDFVNIAPLGDYEKLIEDNDGMAEFLKTEGHKPEHWKLYGIRMSDYNKSLISFTFVNMAVDEGESLKGSVFTNKTGVVRHSFATVDE